MKRNSQKPPEWVEIMGYYEVVVLYGGGCEDIICFKYNGYLNDSNDIVTQAIEKKEQR